MRKKIKKNKEVSGGNGMMKWVPSVVREKVAKYRSHGTWGAVILSLASLFIDSYYNRVDKDDSRRVMWGAINEVKKENVELRDRVSFLEGMQYRVYTTNRFKMH